MSDPKWLDAREIKRWLTLRCAHCGHRFRWKRDARFSFSGNRDVYHDACMGYLHWRRTADERLDVLAIVCEVAGLNGRDIGGVIEMRTENDHDGSAERAKAWRVFNDMGKRA